MVSPLGGVKASFSVAQHGIGGVQPVKDQVRFVAQSESGLAAMGRDGYGCFFR